MKKVVIRPLLFPSLEVLIGSVEIADWFAFTSRLANVALVPCYSLFRWLLINSPQLYHPFHENTRIKIDLNLNWMYTYRGHAGEVRLKGLAREGPWPCQMME